MCAVPPRPARDKRTVTVNINGQRFTVRSDDDDAYLDDLTSFINGKLEAIKKATGRVETGQIALLALLDIVDDLFRHQRENANLKKLITERAEVLLEQIDEMSAALESSGAVVQANAPGGRTTSR